jgi:O-acetyl-ADP-ribose deacetylase
MAFLELIYGYPKREAAKLAIETVRKWMNHHPQFEKIFFVAYDHENYQLYQELL